MKKYKVVFRWLWSRPEVYGGGSYVYEGEKYAVFDSWNPKLFKSAKVAENAAKKLQKSCVNLLGSEYDIEEVDDDE